MNFLRVGEGNKDRHCTVLNAYTGKNEKRACVRFIVVRGKTYLYLLIIRFYT